MSNAVYDLDEVLRQFRDATRSLAKARVRIIELEVENDRRVQEYMKAKEEVASMKSKLEVACKIAGLTIEDLDPE